MYQSLKFTATLDFWSVGELGDGDGELDFCWVYGRGRLFRDRRVGIGLAVL